MQSVLGVIVILAAMGAFLSRRIGRAGAGTQRHRASVRSPRLTPAATRALMVISTLLAVPAALPALLPMLREGLFAFCAGCPFTGGADVHGSPALLALTFFQGVWYYASTVVPVFVLACALSGLLLVRWERIPVHGIARTFAVAAALPLCACGAVPLAKAMMDRGGRSVLDGLVLLSAAPLLSPVVIVLAITVLGWSYLALRIAAGFVMAVLVAFAVRPFLDPLEQVGAGPGAACGPSRLSPTGTAGDGSALIAGWNLLVSLVPYVLYGVVLGSLVATLLPADVVRSALSAGPLSTAAVVVAGFPVNMCAGEEILLTAPLIPAGLTMGHAIAFALAGSGICLSSLPLLAAVLGRRGTLVMASLYLVVPLAIGVLLTAVPFPVAAP